MEQTKQALTWITAILKNYNIPFQIAGGLAARTYGAVRELADIDIDIPEDSFELIIKEVASYIIFGPDHFKDESWDIFLMTLRYNNQEIDLGGAYHTKIYNQKNKTWIKLITDFSTAEHREIMGLKLPVIARNELIAYKKILARPVDLLDIEQMTTSQTPQN